MAISIYLDLIKACDVVKARRKQYNSLRNDFTNALFPEKSYSHWSNVDVSAAFAGMSSTEEKLFML